MRKLRNSPCHPGFADNYLSSNGNRNCPLAGPAACPGCEQVESPGWSFGWPDCRLWAGQRTGRVRGRPVFRLPSLLVVPCELSRPKPRGDGVTIACWSRQGTDETPRFKTTGALRCYQGVTEPRRCEIVLETWGGGALRQQFKRQQLIGSQQHMPSVAVLLKPGLLEEKRGILHNFNTQN